MLAEPSEPTYLTNNPTSLPEFRHEKSSYTHPDKDQWFIARRQSARLRTMTSRQ